METTIFLAQLWGPVILAMGVGIFVSRNYYVKVYRDLEKDVLAVMVFGMVAVVAGTAHILAHNAWGSFAEGLISFLGWGLFFKGLLFIVAPRFIDKAGDFWVNKKLVPLAGVLTLVLGAYLVWFAYLA